VRPGRFAWGVFTGVIAVVLGATLINTIDVDFLVGPLLLPDSPDRAEAIVVPGAGITGPGCALNQSATRRTMLAAKLFKEGRAPLVVFTGGRSNESSCIVGEAMADWAVELGIPRPAIVVEARSSSTWENAVFTRQLLLPRGVHRILIVTDALHALRCVKVFRNLEFEVATFSVPVVQVSSSNIEMLQMAAHEYVGLLYYKMRRYW
jgi:uncharacterized SAM-binding protein YcdF (DUF218 family)